MVKTTEVDYKTKGLIATVAEIFQKGFLQLCSYLAVPSHFKSFLYFEF